MGSSYYGEMKMGNEQRSSSSSSRRGRKNSSEKPLKQPQRGLGVAQLEKIRLHGEMGTLPFQQQHHIYPNFNPDDMRIQTTYSSLSSSSVSHSSAPNFSTGFGEYERANFIYADSHPTTTPIRWDPSNTFVESQQFGQPNMTRHLLNPHVQDSMHKNINFNSKHGSDSIGSSSQNSESSETQELDLELRLSI